MRTRIIVSILLIAVWLAATISPTQAQSGYEWVEIDTSSLQNLNQPGVLYTALSPCANPAAFYMSYEFTSDSAIAYIAADQTSYMLSFTEVEGWEIRQDVIGYRDHYWTGGTIISPDDTEVTNHSSHYYFPADIAADLYEGATGFDLDITAAWYYCPIEPTATPTTEPTSEPTTEPTQTPEPTSTPGPTNVTIISLTGGDMTLERSISYGDVAVVIAILANIGTMIMYILLRLPRLWKR